MEHEAPETLTDAIRYFSDADTCHRFMVALRWPSGVACPRCSAGDPYFIQARRIWACRSCRRQFSVKVGTIFEDSPLPLEKWLPAVWLIANCKNGISSYELARGLGVTQKTAWFMLHRIRSAMQTGTFGQLGGDVEVDETFIGGRARFMHKEKRERVIKGTGPLGKVAVMGLLERAGRKEHSTVRVGVVPSTRKGTLQAKVREHVEPGSNVYTDALKSYDGLEAAYVHGVIDHGVAYVNGKIHTNGLENFWSLLKRAIRGTYVSVEPFHLFRYLDEEAHRFNNRKDDDRGRFLDVLRGSIGRRLTYKALTGADLPETCGA